MFWVAECLIFSQGNILNCLRFCTISKGFWRYFNNIFHKWKWKCNIRGSESTTFLLITFPWKFSIFLKFRLYFFRPSSKSSKMEKSRRTSSSRLAPSTTPSCWPTSGRRAPQRRSWRRGWASATSQSPRSSRPTCSTAPTRFVVFNFYRPWFRQPLFFIFPESLNTGPISSV